MRGEMISRVLPKEVRKLQDKKETTERKGIWKITTSADGKSTQYQVSKRYLKTLRDSELLKLSKQSWQMLFSFRTHTCVHYLRIMLDIIKNCPILILG